MSCVAPFKNKTLCLMNALYFHSQYKLRAYVQDLAQRFKHAATARDYGKSYAWPRPPLVGSHAEAGLRRLFNKWRANMLLRKFPRSEWPQLRLQIVTASALRNRRRFWGQDRKWLGNYLASSAENSNYSNFVTSCNNIRNTDGYKTLLFSAFVKKVNRFNKMADRAIIVTDEAIYKLDGFKNKFRNMKRSVDIKDVRVFIVNDIDVFLTDWFFIMQITTISVTPGRDQLIVFHAPGGNDLIVALQGEDYALKEDRIGELIGIVCKRYTE